MKRIEVAGAFFAISTIASCNSAPKPTVHTQEETSFDPKVTVVDLGDCSSGKMSSWTLQLEPGDDVAVTAKSKSGDKIFVELIDIDSRTTSNPIEISPRGFNDSRIYNLPGQLAVGSPSERLIFNLPYGPWENGGASIDASIECNWQPPKS